MSNTFQFDHNRLFDNLENALNSDLASLAVEANGGRSILFVYPADEDEEYIEEGRHRLTPDKFTFVDIRQTFSDYIGEVGRENFEEMYANFGKEVYRSENSPEGTFFDFLMQRIVGVQEADKSPVLVHTGTLYDLEISNIHIMEDPRVMYAKHQLVVFYPATVEGEKIKFLGKVPASHYRCIVIK
jgi:hypothetical protein